MSAFSLKNYQRQSLDVLRAYLARARIVGAGPAFDQTEKPGVRTPRPYQPLAGLETVPYVCLRLPTGGGKTLLSAHAVEIAADEWLERAFPLVLWLTPTNTIRAQTLETLKKPGHANYEALNDAFGGRFRVFDIADFALLTPADLKAYACIFVGTTQTLRVSNTEGRKVYAHNENLEPHFSAVPDTTPGLERIEEGEDKGQIKFSFRNLLALNRPLVLVDEAHNNKSKLSVEVLQRINAGCVVEFTATPAADSNILHNVSATELKAEEMIKLPIRLTEHKSWEDAVANAIRERKRLHALAEKDADHIRPIVLFQAEDKGQDVTKDILVAHLVEQENIPREKIAVATGDQRELDKVDLFARECPIDYVVTVEALKEGWDCSFAYVFCSVAKVESRTSVEQLLGRVLRMPYAKRRIEPDLNRAYAHVSRASWPNAVNELHDRLVDMGFEQAEAESFIESQPPLDLAGGATGGLFGAPPPSTVLEVNESPAVFDLTPEDREAVKVEKTATGARLVLLRAISDETRDRITAAIRSPEARATVERETRRHNSQWRARMTPAARGEIFRLPQLAFIFQGEKELAEPESFLDASSWTLTDYSSAVSPQEFNLTESGAQWEVDLRDGHLTHKTVAFAEQQNLDFVDTGWTQGQLVQWLEKKLRQQDVVQPVMLEFVRRAVADLMERRATPLPVLARWKYILARILGQKIATHRDAAGRSNYQRLLFGTQAAVEATFDYAFDFTPDGYAPHWTYEGRPYLFQKHFYPLVGELKNKGEEFECAKALDMHPKVRHWVRNLDRRGFWLPLARNRFYPDFVAQLDDGRLLLVEHKGEVYATNDDSKEKSSVGDLWQAKSGGKGLFLMTVIEAGRTGLYEQIDAVIA
ncbi:DEAD/DEAH box helicase family protein [Methylocystis sp. IM3]|uniref:DEAD/DEAH box helicase n=1 Tax=unclassified Methylocystis TaxID=2625913 RepID=UPI0030F4EF8F